MDSQYGIKVPFTNDLPFLIGSITKSMTAISILQLEEEGKLSVSDKLSTYFPELPSQMALLYTNC